MTTKRKHESAKSWCWYCDREFEQDTVLIHHQKAKHFKCSFCNKKLNSAPSMVIHIAQVHKESITKVPNAIAGRENVSLEIFGMQGVPSKDLIEHFEKKGVDSQGLLKKLSIERQSYAQGPGMITRVPALNLVSSTIPHSPPLKTDSESVVTRSNHHHHSSSSTNSSSSSILPPPLLAAQQQSLLKKNKPNSSLLTTPGSKDSMVENK